MSPGDITRRVALLREIFILNELGGNIRLRYRFSDPDGVRTGKSGWSFGICQFDVKNNPVSRTCLTDCGFSEREIGMLIEQTAPMDAMQAKLAANSAVVDRYDDSEINQVVRWVSARLESARVECDNEAAFLALCDYHNQFCLERNGKMITFLRALRRPATMDDILVGKLSTVWGEKRPGDVVRRYNGIVKVLKEAL